LQRTETVARRPCGISLSGRLEQNRLVAFNGYQPRSYICRIGSGAVATPQIRADFT
jgi:hypothetical protein